MDFIQAILEKLKPAAELSVFVDGDLLRGEIKHYERARVVVVADAVVEGIDIDTLMRDLDDAAERWLAQEITPT